MHYVTLHDRRFRRSIPCAEIERAIADLAERIVCDYRDRPRLLFVVILNGAFVFAAQLLKGIGLDCEVSFVKLESYAGTASSGRVGELIGLNCDVAGREVIVLEDIVESGGTIQAVDRLLRAAGAARIRYAALFFKPACYTKPIPIDYAAMTLDDDFIVGYGLDYDGLGRNLKDIYTLVP